MPEFSVQVTGYECTRCRNKWIPKQQHVRPVSCPACKSPYWDRPRKNRYPRIAAHRTKGNVDIA